MPTPHESLDLPRTLDGDLTLRLAAPEDADDLVAFNNRIHEDEAVGIWTRDLMFGDHPTTSADDFALVEDAEGNILSSTVLIPQTWVYEGIPFEVGQFEIVGTDPAHRRRGLTRAVMEVLHELSAAYGHHVQAVLGIPWFYRQFGYEYALAVGGLYHLPVTRITALKPGEVERYHCRPADEPDLPTIMRRHDAFFEDRVVTTQMREDIWLYHLGGHSRGAVLETRLFMVENLDGAVVGYYRTAAALRGTVLFVMALALADGVSYHDVLPAVLRALKAQGREYAAAQSRREAQSETPPPEETPKPQCTDIVFELGEAHPVYKVLGRRLDRYQKPYAWYLRLPDVAAFINHIAPALEERLADSLLSGYTGALKLNFYQGGLHLRLDEGKITSAVNLETPDADDEPDAAFPPLVFLKLLFCYRSLTELRDAFPDCWAKDEAALLLDALFPKGPSWITMVA